MTAPALESDLHHGVLKHIHAGFCVIQVLFEGEQAVDYRFLEVNDAFERHTGLKGAQGKRMSALEPQHERDWFRIYGEVARTGQPAQFEMEARALGRSFAVDAVRVGEPGEDKVGILFFDVTARKQIEVELGESEARFSALADGLPMPVWVLDERGHARFVNSAFSEFFGGDETRVPEDVWRGLVHPDDASVFEYELQEALTVQRSMHALVRARRADGQWRWLEMNARPRFSRMGRFIGLAGSSPDVTERREIELAREELLQSERAARSAAENMARLKDEFLATLSHELRTPLTTIRMAADLMFERRDEFDPATSRAAELLQNQLDRFEELLVDLLEISRFDAGAAVLDVEACDVNALVARAVEQARPLAVRIDTSLEFHPAPNGAVAAADSRRINRVVRNLLDNAIEHSDGRGVVVTVGSDALAVAVTVRDFGLGLRPGEAGLVFNRFWRADPARARTTGGTGLGLSIAFEDARLHGGWLEAWGEPGQGSSFRLTLPRTARGTLAGSPLPLVPLGFDSIEDVDGSAVRLDAIPGPSSQGFQLPPRAGRS